MCFCVSFKGVLTHTLHLFAVDMTHLETRFLQGCIGSKAHPATAGTLSIGLSQDPEDSLQHRLRPVQGMQQPPTFSQSPDLQFETEVFGLD